MTKTEMADLEVAIGLITGLRAEMQSGFQSITESLGDVKQSQAAHLAVHEERDKKAASQGVTRRWVLQVVAASTLTIAGIVIGAAWHFLGI